MTIYKWLYEKHFPFLCISFLSSLTPSNVSLLWSLKEAKEKRRRKFHIFYIPNILLNISKKSKFYIHAFHKYKHNMGNLFCKIREEKIFFSFQCQIIVVEGMLNGWESLCIATKWNKKAYNMNVWRVKSEGWGSEHWEYPFFTHIMWVSSTFIYKCSNISSDIESTWKVNDGKLKH